MATGEVVGSVGELWRFPVKSMRGEQLPEAEVTARGVLGDRAYALVDTHGQGRECEECEAVSRHPQLHS